MQDLLPRAGYVTPPWHASSFHSDEEETASRHKKEMSEKRRASVETGTGWKETQWDDERDWIVRRRDEAKHYKRILTQLFIWLQKNWRLTLLSKHGATFTKLCSVSDRRRTSFSSDLSSKTRWTEFRSRNTFVLRGASRLCGNNWWHQAGQTEEVCTQNSNRHKFKNYSRVLFLLMNCLFKLRPAHLFGKEIQCRPSKSKHGEVFSYMLTLCFHS